MGNVEPKHDDVGVCVCKDRVGLALCGVKGHLQGRWGQWPAQGIRLQAVVEWGWWAMEIGCRERDWLSKNHECEGASFLTAGDSSSN